MVTQGPEFFMCYCLLGNAEAYPIPSSPQCQRRGIYGVEQMLCCKMQEHARTLGTWPVCLLQVANLHKQTDSALP